MNRIHVLYVDDEEENLVSFKAVFRREFTVFTALSVADAKVILSQNDIHVLLTDQRMPVANGTELLAQAVLDYPDQVRILLTGFADIEAIQDAINRGQIFSYLQKPWNEDVLRSTIIKAFELFSRKKEQESFTEKLITSNEQLEFYLRQKLIS